MPSTIPYDPGLVLGQIIHTSKIDGLKRRAEIQKKKDAAENDLQQTILAKNKLTMIQKELVSMGVGQDKMDELKSQIESLDGQLVAKAGAYATASIDAAKMESEETNAQEQKQINEEPESPIDFSASQLMQLDLSSDTMTMNVQVSLFI